MGIIVLGMIILLLLLLMIYEIIVLIVVVGLLTAADHQGHRSEQAVAQLVLSTACRSSPLM